MNQRVRTFTVATLMTCVGCASLQVKTIGEDKPGAANEYTTACRIKADSSAYIARVVRIRAIYRTDTMYYAYLESSECPKSPRMIEVDHPLNTKGDATVVAFFSLEKRMCANKTVCPIELMIDVDILVKQTQSGLFAEFKHVHYAKART